MVFHLSCISKKEITVNKNTTLSGVFSILGGVTYPTSYNPGDGCLFHPPKIVVIYLYNRLNVNFPYDLCLIVLEKHLFPLNQIIILQKDFILLMEPLMKNVE